jgi:hypothetical protein
MSRNRNYLLGLLFAFQAATAQDKAAYDKSKISTEAELNSGSTNKRGIESKTGIIYYIEKDKKTITAYEKSKIKWQTDIIEVCGRPAVGKPEIRYLRLDKETLKIVFGKHSFASVDINTGKATYLGTD